MITMYGAAWCGDCVRAKAHLERNNVDFDYVDLEAHPDRVSEAQELAGRSNIPVIVFDDGTVLVEPSNKEIDSVLQR